MADWDFIGFTYNGCHSVRDLGIYRVSSGDRYEENLTPTMTDKTADVPGGDGQYYFGTQYKNKIFKIDYAFDNLDDEKIRKIKNLFSGDGIYDLVFDERPYMAWSAKVTGTPSMKYLCFEENGQRVYKGEGSIAFTCYYPYAHTPKKLWIQEREDPTDSNNRNTVIAYREMDGKLLGNYTNLFYPNSNQWYSSFSDRKEFAIEYRLEQPTCSGMEAIGVLHQPHSGAWPTIKEEDRSKFFALITFNKRPMNWGDTMVFFPLQEKLMLHRKNGSIEWLAFAWVVQPDNDAWFKHPDLTSCMYHKQTEDSFYRGNWAYTAIWENYNFSGDIEAPFLLAIKNKTGANKTCIALHLQLGENIEFAVELSTPFVIKNNEAVYWNTKTGLIQAKNETIPSTGQLLARTPSKNMNLSPFDSRLSLFIEEEDDWITICDIYNEPGWDIQTQYDYLYR